MDPAPLPTFSRGVYGFVLYLLSWLGLCIYLAWAYIPNHCFHSIGLYYIPHKHWSITIPVLAVSSFIITFYIIYPIINYFTILPYHSLNTILDKHSNQNIHNYLNEEELKQKCDDDKGNGEGDCDGYNNDNDGFYNAYFGYDDDDVPIPFITDIDIITVNKRLYDE